MASTGTADDTRRLLHRRLRNQLLSSSRRREPHEIVSHLGAVQAQDYGAAKWAIALRGRLRDVDVERSFNDGAIVRTHVLRPTWHFVPPADIRWMLALTASRVKAAMASQFRAAGLDARELISGARILERILGGGRHLTRADLAQALPRARFALGGQRLACLLMYAELEGVVCSGVRRARQMTYALLDERVPPAPGLDRDQALTRLAARYFAGHGPATAADFAWWSGLTVGDARRSIEILASELVRVVVDGQTYWQRRARAGGHPPRNTLHLLPPWDEYVVGYTKREALLLPDAAPGIDPRAGILSNTIAINGRIAGTWRRTLARDRLIIEAVRLRRWSSIDHQLLLRAVKEYGAFLQLPVSSTVR